MRYFTPLKNNILYTAKHWLAYQRTAKQLGLWRVRFLLHDVDKLFLYIILPKRIVHKLHRLYSTHHVRGNHVIDPLAAVIDWECARFTKSDKPLNAKETFEKYYPNCKDVIQYISLIQQHIGNIPPRR